MSDFQKIFFGSKINSTGLQTQSGYMSIKKGILYHVGHTNKEWVEEISRVYEKRESTGLFPEDKYEGEIENGKPNGHGILTYKDEGTYVGEWKNGEFHGQGTFKYGRMAIRHGYVLEGEYKDGKAHGQMITTYPDGRKYKGTWVDGESQDDQRLIID